MGLRNAAGILIALSLTASACSSGPHYSPDSWHAPPPPPYPFQCESLPAGQFVEVGSDAFARYASALEQSPAVALELGEVAGIAPTGFVVPLQGNPYLLRALFLNHATGRFGVCVSRSSVLVSHGSLGASPVPMRRSALLAFLETPPAQVYVSVSMAR